MEIYNLIVYRNNRFAGPLCGNSLFLHEVDMYMYSTNLMSKSVTIYEI